MAVVVGVEVENRDDVRMPELGRGAALAQEAFARLTVGVWREQHLERHVVAEGDAARLVDLPHAAGAERTEDLVAAVDDVAGGQHPHSLAPAGGAQA